MERPERLDLQSADGAQLNLDALYQIAPSCFTEAKDPKTGKIKRVVNFDVLRQLLGDDTVEDATDIWCYNNAQWYIRSGSTPLNNHTGARAHRHLLQNFVETADAAIASGRNSATLRFGHESVVLPVVCLMGLNGMDYETTHFETLADHWRSYEVFPMAANLQIIYYRKPGSNDILVKILLNEHEATLPIATDCAPYYHWTDVRQHFLSRIGN